MRQLDKAGLLDSSEYRARRQRVVDEFRARPTRAAVDAGGAYPRAAGGPAIVSGQPLHRARWSRITPGTGLRPSRRALIAPHIDLHRGGHSYAWGYRALAESEPAELYVLLGTSHQPMRQPFAATARPYDTPFGPVDRRPGVSGAARCAWPHSTSIEDELATSASTRSSSRRCTCATWSIQAAPGLAPGHPDPVRSTPARRRGWDATRGRRDRGFPPGVERSFWPKMDAASASSPAPTSRTSGRSSAIQLGWIDGLQIACGRATLRC